MRVAYGFGASEQENVERVFCFLERFQSPEKVVRGQDPQRFLRWVGDPIAISVQNRGAPRK
jgi:hypothetical protein